MIKTTKKGRAVCADYAYRKGDIVEKAPVIFIPLKEMKTNYILAYYVFWWGNDKVGLALGTGSLYNHSGDPNMEFYRVKNHVVFKALRPIRVGEELTISYTHDRSDPQFLSPDRARFARTGSTKENK